MLLDINDKNKIVLLAVLAVLLLIAVSFLVFRRLKKTRSKRKIKRVMRKLGKGVIRDVMLPDGTGGFVHMDFIVLTAHGLVVFDVKDYAGLLFGGEKVDYWTQMIDRKSYKFENPLFQNQNRVLSLKAIVGNVPVFGHVVFTNVGKFPKGVPENTFMLDSLLAATPYRGDHSKIAPELKQAWKTLGQVVVEESTV